ncbi:MAG TPA: response regulator [Polyangia bacterium]
MKQILLIDDSVTIQRVVEITFAREDYTVTAVKSADEGIQRARDLKPDVVLIDAGLPGKSGYDVCGALKGDAATSGLPCLLLTANFSPYDEVKGGKAGVDGHLVKPFETQALIDKVGDVIKKGARPSAGAAVGPTTSAPSAPTMAAPAPAPQLPKPPVAPPPKPAAPMSIEPLSKPLSVVAQETAHKHDDSVEIAIERPRPPIAPAPARAPAPAKTMMGISAPVPPAPALVPPPAPHPPVTHPPSVAHAPAPILHSPPPAIVHAQAAMPAQTPQMPRAPLIPHTPTPAPMTAKAQPAPAKPAAPPPRATLMGIPTVNPSSLGPGAVALPPPGKPAAPWQPPGPMSSPSAPPPAISAAVAAVAERAQEEISTRGPEYDAIAKLSREVIERIAWEVVPELAEVIIREQLDRLVKERS